MQWEYEVYKHTKLVNNQVKETQKVATIWLGYSTEEERLQIAKDNGGDMLQPTGKWRIAE